MFFKGISEEGLGAWELVQYEGRRKGCPNLVLNVGF